jgi:hypothetical protein
MKKEEMSYFTEDLKELVILNGKALRDINEGEILISFGRLVTEEDLK